MDKRYLLIFFIGVFSIAVFYLTNIKKNEDVNIKIINKQYSIHEDTIVKSENKTPENKTATSSIKILLVGDISFDRYIRQVSNKNGKDFIFSCINNFLSGFDLIIGNLEGPITDNDSVSIGTVVGSPQNYVFTFPTTSAMLLAQYNINIVNLGNNHIGNFGMSGIVSTQKYLKLAGVNYFGGLIGDEPVYRIGKISFISYNEFGGQSYKEVSSIIKSEKTRGNTVIVYAHWGEEYTDSILKLRDMAILFSENGADVIVGSHPHVVLPSEYINKTLVYYSLGNFIFDQYFNSQVRNGLTLSLDISEDGFSVKEFPVSLELDGRTCPII